MATRPLRGGKDWQNLPGGLTGVSKGPRTVEPKNKNNTKPGNRNKNAEK